MRNAAPCSFFKNKSRSQAAVFGPDSPLFAHFTASVFMGSTLSHFKQRSSVLPVRSVIAIQSFLHFGQRSFMASFLPCLAGNLSRENRREVSAFIKKHWYYVVCRMPDIGTSFNLAYWKCEVSPRNFTPMPAASSPACGGQFCDRMALS